MKIIKKKLFLACITAVTTGCPIIVNADNLTDALKASTVSGDFNLRYENVDTDSADSDGLTFRSRLTITTGSIGNFQAVAGFEDVRDVFGIDDENNLIPDPETTEVDQAFLQYTSPRFSAKIGRQVIALDNQRFIGHVGWRQDRQTYDAVSTTFTPVAGLDVFAGYIYKRNRVLAETADVDSRDFLLNAACQTPLGKLVGYAYFLDNDENSTQIDTYGFSLNGAIDGEIKLSYTAEYASQSIDLANGANFDTSYLLVEGGITLFRISAKTGYEVLGSDDGMASFTTPLGTVHKFNGWSDIFLPGALTPTTLPNGVKDAYIGLSGTLEGIDLLVTFHDFASEVGSIDYGSEYDLQAVKKFAGGYRIGVKYGSYKADNLAVDTDKLWIWAGLSF